MKHSDAPTIIDGLFTLRCVRIFPGVNSRAELVTLAPGLRQERRFAPLARGLLFIINYMINTDEDPEADLLIESFAIIKNRHSNLSINVNRNQASLLTQIIFGESLEHYGNGSNYPPFCLVNVHMKLQCAPYTSFFYSVLQIHLRLKKLSCIFSY